METEEIIKRIDPDYIQCLSCNQYKHKVFGFCVSDKLVCVACKDEAIDRGIHGLTNTHKRN